jgi:WD40 repeat protein
MSLLLLQDMGEEKVFDTLSAHDRHISSLSVSLDGNLLLSASHDGTAKVRTTPQERGFFTFTVVRRSLTIRATV